MPSSIKKDLFVVVILAVAVYVTPARIEILWEKCASNVLTLDLGAYDPDFSEIKLLPRYKRMVTWKLVEPLLTPHRRYPDKMTSPFVWKSIASTRSLPLGSLEYPQFVFGLLDRLRQQSQLARGKNNYLIACPTIPNVCLFVCWCWCYCFFDSWTKDRVERLGFFSFKEPFFVRCLNYSAKVCWICLLGVKDYDILALQTRSFSHEQILYGPYWSNFMLPHSWHALVHTLQDGCQLIQPCSIFLRKITCSVTNPISLLN